MQFLKLLLAIVLFPVIYIFIFLITSVLEIFTSIGRLFIGSWGYFFITLILLPLTISLELICNLFTAFSDTLGVCTYIATGKGEPKLSINNNNSNF